MKKIFLINLLFIFTIFGCSTKPTKQEALDYYTNIKYENVMPYYNFFKSRNIKMLQFYKEAFQKDPRSFTDLQMKELIGNQKKIISILNNAITNINKLEDLGDKSKFKDATLTHLKKQMKFENETVNSLIDLYKDNILDYEIDSILEKLSKVAEMKEISYKYGESEIVFLTEFGIAPEEVGLINNKYGFSKVE